ncbi:MAG TPA: hypothetical protein VKV37_24310 [Ktedonobacteraceae bacterium]|nr:hypothetical protein [Ktedonobacteraceae bacterium]
MPSIKCIACGHRILLPAVLAICPNCGTPLPSPDPAPRQDENCYAIAKEPELLCPLCERPIVEIPHSGVCPHCGTSLTSSGRSLIASASRSMAPGAQSQPPARDVPPDIYLHVPAAREPEHPDLFTAAPMPARTRYPFWFPRRPPDLEGVIVQVQSQLENAHSSAGGSVLGQLRDMIWPLPVQEARSEKEQVLVTMLRVRIADGTQRDARLQGYQTGVNPSLGDTVSLWGWQRRGVLRVSHGYNHTTRGVISTTAMTSPLPALLLLAALLIVFSLLFHWYHIPLLPHWP